MIPDFYAFYQVWVKNNYGAIHCMFGSQFFNNCRMAPLQSKIILKNLWLKKLSIFRARLPVALYSLRALCSLNRRI